MNNDFKKSLSLEKKPLEYIDVDSRDDFPPEHEGMRFIHFYGGTKNYRAYIAPADISRADFMEQYPESLDRKQSTINRNSSVNSARREFASRISNGGKYNELISLREQFEDNNTVVLEDNIETKNDGSR